MVEAGADAATDVTGFGLLGHLHFMLKASGVSATVDASRVPLLPGTRELARDGVVPGGTHRNHEFLESLVDWGGLPEPEQLVLADAQTSGGLLIAARQGERLELAAAAHGVPVFEIGAVREGRPGGIAVTGRVGGEIRPH
jgi:selenide,water dikinase